MGPLLFHLAFPVTDLKETKRFYIEGLGCTQGRESRVALTLNLAGHQIIAQLTKSPPQKQEGIYPRHFGLVFTVEEDWKALAHRAKIQGLTFYQEPRSRFMGSRLEHQTFFLEDPSYNLLEFKHYTYESAIFGEHEMAEVGDSDEPR